ncbi:unnamed protein product [Owenia fusiformis]|uniref:Uncharacterized protein n=1 Tax=Owenia fusiformis TaxID=6347 RepID=A0A8S4NQW3_OWEFU|nr:unnamed protein product [Owenia fusiformis]
MTSSTVSRLRTFLVLFIMVAASFLILHRNACKGYAEGKIILMKIETDITDLGNLIVKDIQAGKTLKNNELSNQKTIEELKNSIKDISNLIESNIKHEAIKEQESIGSKRSSIIERKLNRRDESCDVMLNIMTTFPVLTSTKDKAQHGFVNYSAEIIQSRQLEYVRALEMNIMHPCVEKVHLLVENLGVKSYLMSLNLTAVSQADIEAMVHFHKLLYFPTYKAYAIYANENLMFKTVAIMNGDISLGDGFNLIKNSYLIGDRVAYSLTRHSSLLPNCGNNANFCLQTYMGYHDAHILYMDTAFDNWSLDFLAYPINRLGVENLFMYVLSQKLNKIVLNPCRILKNHHNHCSGLRSNFTTSEKIRVNIGQNKKFSWRSPFTYRLH